MTPDPSQAASETRRTVLITGASTGIGAAIAERFMAEGWTVIATKLPSEMDLGPNEGEGLIVIPMDVTDDASVEAAVSQALSAVGNIDVLVNNAGISAFGPFETMDDRTVRRLFDVNLLGTVRVIRKLIPYLEGGAIINISSSLGRSAIPLMAPYIATKYAIEGLTESLRYELRQRNIIVKLIEPGPVDTRFYEPAGQVDAVPEAYRPLVGRAMPKLRALGRSGLRPEDVAGSVHRAAIDGSQRLRYPIGREARLTMTLLRILPESWVRGIVRVVFT